MKEVQILPGRRPAWEQYGELASQLELVAFLTWRDLKVRYQQTVLGAAWAILQPLALMAAFSLFLGRVIPRPSSDVPYGIFAYTALIPWTFLASALNRGANSLVGNAPLLSKVYFSRLVLPISAVLTHLVDYVIALVLLLVVLPLVGLPLTLRALAVVPLTLALLLVAVGPTLLLAALNVRIRDVAAALPLVVQFGLFASPVIYPTTIIPERWLWLYGLNPVAPLVEGFRWSLLGQPYPRELLSLGTPLAVIGLLALGNEVFRRSEQVLADVV